jgi:hypothetical protein
MTTQAQRPVRPGPIYFAIEKYVPDAKLYPEGDQLAFLNTKPVWTGYFPEEVGYRYQELCDHATRYAHKCNGGLRVGEDGVVTVYSQEELETDYDPTEV